jgi:hypothetical protein
MKSNNTIKTNYEETNYLEDNMDMIFGTEFFYSPQDGKLINRLLTNYSGLTESIITNG